MKSHTPFKNSMESLKKELGAHKKKDKKMEHKLEREIKACKKRK